MVFPVWAAPFFICISECRYARTAAGGGGGKHSLLIVEKGMAGFSLGQRIKDKLGMRASPTAELVFDNVRRAARRYAFPVWAAHSTHAFPNAPRMSICILV